MSSSQTRRHSNGATQSRSATQERRAEILRVLGERPITTAELALDLPMRQRFAFEAELATARATGVSPWQIPDALISYEGQRRHVPKYAVSNGRVHYEYEYWLGRFGT